MDLFDELLDKAKVAFDVAVKTTEDVVDVGKQKYNIAAFENKISKDYKALGEIFYNFKKNGEIDSEKVENLIADIDDKKEKLALLRNEIDNSANRYKCTNCGALVDDNMIFCSLCGQKIEFKAK